MITNLQTNEVHSEWKAFSFLNEGAKEEAFKAMPQLEGWCSQQKASILIDLIYLIDAKKIVEIGVFGGKSLVPMAFALKEKGGGKAYGIDPWQKEDSIEGMTGVNEEWWGQVDHEGIYQNLKHQIRVFGLEAYLELIRSNSEKADPIFDIDLLHIDGNHSEKASLIDVIKWVPLVRTGGVIIFDDVNWVTTRLAVEWLDQTCVKIGEIKGDNVWGIWIKK